jgi:hypothetical protein
MLSLRQRILPSFVDVDGVVMPLPRLGHRSLHVIGINFKRLLGPARKPPVLVAFIELGTDSFPDPEATTKDQKFRAYTLPTLPMAVATIYRYRPRHFGYGHVFHLEQQRMYDPCGYLIQADVALTGDELLRCYLAWADDQGMVHAAGSADHRVLPWMDLLGDDTIPDMCKRHGLRCELVQEIAFCLRTGWTPKPLTIYRIETSHWPRYRRWGEVYAHVLPASPALDDAVVFAATKLNPRAVREIYDSYCERRQRRLPQSVLPLLYRGAHPPSRRK